MISNLTELPSEEDLEEPKVALPRIFPNLNREGRFMLETTSGGSRSGGGESAEGTSHQAYYLKEITQNEQLRAFGAIVYSSFEEFRGD